MLAINIALSLANHVEPRGTFFINHHSHSLRAIRHNHCTRCNLSLIIRKKIVTLARFYGLSRLSTENPAIIADDIFISVSAFSFRVPLCVMMTKNEKMSGALKRFSPLSFFVLALNCISPQGLVDFNFARN